VVRQDSDIPPICRKLSIILFSRRRTCWGHRISYSSVEVLEKREAIVNTLQTNFPCAETEHKNAPLYVQVSWVA